MQHLLAKAAQYWNQWQAQRMASGARYVDWGDHPRVLANIQANLFGSSDTTVFDYLKAHYPLFPQAHALSLCSGDGGFEQLLLSQQVFGSVVGLDIAAERVSAANVQAQSFDGRLQFEVGDVNSGNFGREQYDVVFAKAALHHVEALEIMFEGVRRCLKPGGYLVAIDFFGPTRFQWTDRQLQATNDFLQRQVPESLRRRTDGSLHEQVRRPTIAQMIDMDPSEAVRSSELESVLRQYLEVVEEKWIGGTLLNLIFDSSIVNNFEAGRPEHDAIIDAAYRLERELVQSGEIGCDFKLLVGRV